MSKTKKAKEGITPLPLHVDGNGDILDEDSLLVARPQDRKHARYICLAVNSHDELVEALSRMVPKWAYTDLDPQAGDGQAACEVSVGDLRAAITALTRAKSTGGEG